MKALQSNALIYPQSILNVTHDDFSARALDVFRFQHEHCAVYRAFCDALGKSSGEVTTIEQIPFLPISFFRTHKVVTDLPPVEPEIYFESSGTTGEQTSRHFVLSKEVYEQSLIAGFRQFYGDPGNYAILALLPSYLERPNASLVFMARTLIACGAKAGSGFYINEWESLAQRLKELETERVPTLLLGVTFALLDFSEAHPINLTHTIIMETGGMKGRRKEMTREEVHEQLKKQHGLTSIHSEYGMTELLSQAYSNGEGIFSASSTMKVLVRDVNDPLDIAEKGTGALNIIDLANVYSCSFIATDDMGTVAADGSFTVTGRLDHTILRGCSQMAI